MKYLTVGFSEHKGILSWLIKKSTNSPCSHTYIRYPSGDEHIVFQASKISVNTCNWRYFQEKNKIVEEYSVEISDEQFAYAQRFCSEEVGKPYSVKQLVGFLWVIAMHAIGRKVSNPLADGDHSFVCAEVVAECIGLENPESLTQEDVRRWCAKYGYRLLS